MSQERLCPSCQQPMRRERWRQTKIERCAACSLFFTDAVELDFILGEEGLEKGLARLARPVDTPERCPGCGASMLAVHTGFSVRRQGAHPYRDAAMMQAEIAALSYCEGCGGFVLAEELLVRLVDAFAAHKETSRPADVAWFQSFRGALLAALHRPAEPSS